jgi:tetratricopeptide (TPR) repeat protein
MTGWAINGRRAALLVGATVVLLLSTSHAHCQSVTDQQSESTISIVIPSFEVQQALPTYEWLRDYLPQGMASFFSANPSIRVIEREDLDMLLEEIEFSLSNLADSGERIRFEGFRVATHLLSGSFAIAGGELVIAARLLEIRSGEIVAAAQVSGSPNDLIELQRKVAGNIIGVIFPDYAAPSAQGAGLRLSDHRAVHRAHQLWSEIPFHELDPRRRRRRAEYQLVSDQLEMLLLDNPQYLDGYKYLGHFSHQLGLDDRAGDYFRYLADMQGDSAAALVGLGDLARHDYQPDEAVALYRRATEIDPTSPGAWYGLMQASFDLDDYRHAAVAVLKAIELRPDLAVLYARLDRIAERIGTGGRWPASLEPARKLITGWKHLREGRFERAWSTMISSFQYYPKLFFVPYAEGRLAMQEGRYRDAVDALLMAESLHPGYAATHLALGDAYAAIDSRVDAVAHLRTYVHLSREGEDFAEIERRIRSLE